MAKADQFYLAAETIATTIEDQDIADAYVTLCVHAGIALALVSTPMVTITKRRSRCSPRLTAPTRSTSRSSST